MKFFTFQYTLLVSISIIKQFLSIIFGLCVQVSFFNVCLHFPFTFSIYNISPLCIRSSSQVEGETPVSKTNYSVSESSSVQKLQAALYSTYFFLVKSHNYFSTAGSINKFTKTK